jgi:hypothetical protein
VSSPLTVFIENIRLLAAMHKGSATLVEKSGPRLVNWTIAQDLPATADGEPDIMIFRGTDRTLQIVVSFTIRPRSRDSWIRSTGTALAWRAAVRWFASQPGQIPSDHAVDERGQRFIFEIGQKSGDWTQVGHRKESWRKGGGGVRLNSLGTSRGGSLGYFPPASSDASASR